MKKLIFATHNPNKLREVRQILTPLNIEVIGADESGIPDIEETGTTFLENALLKAQHAFNMTGLPALADDSGLCIQALNGAPGLYSARFAAQNGGYPSVFEKITELMGNNPDKSAYFICLMVFVWRRNEYQAFEGRIHGHITNQPEGLEGFGYDPIFIPEGFSKPVATLPAEEKNKLSHRAKALEQVFCFLKNHPELW